MEKKQGDMGGDNILNVYPRPQMKRDSFINLNGYWDYAVTKEDGIPDVYDGKILVPFSPESKMSGVGRTINGDDILWYHRELRMEKEIENGHLLLHFGAIDQEAWIYINGFLAAHHMGGYLGFAVDITGYVSADNDIYVKVKDLHGNGKCSVGGQVFDKTYFSGIWQTVWLEEVPEHYIKSVQLVPVFDECLVELTVLSDSNYLCKARIDDKEVVFESNRRVVISLENVIEWTPEYPYLYTVKIEMLGDKVESYFGMRKISIGQDENGIQKIFLNNRPYFCNGICDEGYHGDAGYTPMSDRAMVYDIYSVKKMGFNTIRKHLKVEPLRWYYHCDRMGILVWQDILTGALMEYEIAGMLKLLGNCTCIVAWIAPEQRFGEYDCVNAFRSIMSKDRTRIINMSSYNKKNTNGDIKSVFSANILNIGNIDIKDKNKRAAIVMDAGRYECQIRKEYARELVKKMTSKYSSLYTGRIWKSYRKGLSGVIFNYLSDSRRHFCGIFTKDRKLAKYNRSVIRMINSNYNRNDV